MDRGSSIVGRHSREKDEAPAAIGYMCRISYVSILPHVVSCFIKLEFAHISNSAFARVNILGQILNLHTKKALGFDIFVKVQSFR